MGDFFGGPPAAILASCQEGRVELAISVDILYEYERVCHKLSVGAPGIDFGVFLALVTVGATLVESPLLPSQVCADPDDDKFLACAIASGSKLIVSGDKQLLATTGYHGVRIIRPGDFVDQYLSKS